MICDQETVVFLVVCLALCVGVIWHMHESHKEEVVKLWGYIEVEREVPRLLAKWEAEGRPSHIEEGHEEVSARMLLRMGIPDGIDRGARS